MVICRHVSQGQMMSVNGSVPCHDDRYTCNGYNSNNSSVCRVVFSRYNITRIQTNANSTQSRTEHILNTLRISLNQSHDAKESCLVPSIWVLCLISMPPCSNNTCGRIRVCSEACLTIRDQLCRKEWASIAALKRDQLLKEDIEIPDCESLPSKSDNQSCIFPQVLHDYQLNGDDNQTRSTVIWIAILAAFLFCAFVIVVGVFCKCRSAKRKPAIRVSFTQNAGFQGQLAEMECSQLSFKNPTGSKSQVIIGAASITKIPRSALSYVGDIGEGAFGQVVHCQLSDGYDFANVAVKYLKTGASERSHQAFEKEIELLSSCDHGNIITLVGVCVDDLGPKCLVLEFMPRGDLAQFLRDGSGTYHAVFGNEGQLPSDVTFVAPLHPFQILTHFASQITSGMEYLSANRFVHRDLAARNCLVGDNSIVKVADFGLAHDVYASDYYRIDEQRVLPVRWLPPEALTTGTFTVMSDVWSFGVVLWELFTYGVQPYFGSSNKEVTVFIQQHRLLQRPAYCPTAIYDMMLSCWHYQSTKRATFNVLKDTLDGWDQGKAPFLSEHWQHLLDLEDSGETADM